MMPASYSAGQPRLLESQVLAGVTGLTPADISVLDALGIVTSTDLLHFQPLHSARSVVAIARAGGPYEALPAFILDTEIPAVTSSASMLSIRVLKGISDVQVKALHSVGIQRIAELAHFPPLLRAEAAMEADEDEYHAAPSAPSELMPALTGGIASTARFASLIRQLDVRNLDFDFEPDCVPRTPISGLFTAPRLRCPVLYLGFSARYLQQWTHLGTALGEVVHSLALAPGQSKQIAVVDWRRRQRAARDEDTTASESLASITRHRRALDEVTSAVAGEHQFGWTQTEVATLATGAAAVVAGGVAGGVGGSLIGAGIGSLAAGVGAAPGALIGAGVGGIAGVAGAGLAVAGAGTIGMIEADTRGDREITADVAQRIMQSTSQHSSVTRSVWSTVVVEDVEREDERLETTNVTNYNRMHALTVQFYEILQRYWVEIGLDRVEPLLYLPLGVFDFDKPETERLWRFIRPLIESDEERQLIDEFYGLVEPAIQRREVEIPDDPGDPPSDLYSITVEDIELNYTSTWSHQPTVEVLFTTADGVKEVAELKNQGPTNTPPRDFSFTSSGATDSALLPRALVEITGLRVRVEMGIRGETRVNIAATLKLRLADGTETARRYDLPRVIFYPGSDHGDTEDQKTIDWSPAQALVEDNEEYRRAMEAYDAAIADDAAAQAEYEKAQEERQDARDAAHGRLLFRLANERHAFTRAILLRTEAETLVAVLDALRLKDGNQTVPLHQICHTVPVAIAGHHLILKLKHLSPEPIRILIGAPSPTHVDSFGLRKVLEYPHQVLEEAEKLKQQAVDAREIDLPSNGLFAESLLGRANGAERLDLERFTAWHEMPIPHQPPPIAALQAQSRTQLPDLQPTTPPATINLQGPVSFPDPTGLTGVLQAIQNPNLFRDMSKAAELTSIIGSLSQLAGQMGQAATQMTGEAATQALKSATEIGQSAAKLTEQAMATYTALNTNAPKNQTELGGRLNKLQDMAGQTPEADFAQRYQDTMHDLLARQGDGNVEFAKTTNEGETSEFQQETRFMRKALGYPMYAPEEMIRSASNASSKGKVFFDNWKSRKSESDEGIHFDRSVGLIRWYRVFIKPLFELAKENDHELGQLWHEWRAWFAELEKLYGSAALRDFVDGAMKQSVADSLARWPEVLNAVMEMTAYRIWETLNPAYLENAQILRNLAEDIGNLLGETLVINPVADVLFLTLELSETDIPETIAPGEQATFRLNATVRLQEQINLNPRDSSEVEVVIHDGGESKKFLSPRQNGKVMFKVTRNNSTGMQVKVILHSRDSSASFIQAEKVFTYPALP